MFDRAAPIVLSIETGHHALDTGSSMMLIFGIRTTASVSLSITAQGAAPAQPPSLKIQTSTQTTEVECRDNTWTVTLSPGDQIVYLPAQDNGWLAASLAFSLSAPQTIVVVGSNAAPQSWTAAAGLVAPADTKNPWPPPTLTGLDATPLVDADWLTTTLIEMRPPANLRWIAPTVRPAGVR